MAKKKLSRDQKRRLKKYKEKQRKKRQQSAVPKSKWSNLKVKYVQPDDEAVIRAVAATNFDAQEKRIKQVFGTDEILSVEANTLQTYFNYIEENLEMPCLLSGIESMGYFGWEARYSFGYGSKTEYEEWRQERASFRDQFELEEFEAILDVDWDILVDVRRTSDDKRFTIPLSELQAVDKTSQNYQLLKDYTVWFVNWH